MKAPNTANCLTALLFLAGLTAGFAPAADFQTDLLVGESRENLVGDGAYLGGSQKIKIAFDSKSNFFVRAENDGDLPDSIVLRGRKGNRHFAVKYFDESNGNANITAALIQGQFTTPVLASGEGISIRGEVERTNKREKKGKGKGNAGKRKNFKVSGVSANNPAALDKVRAFMSSGKKPGGKKPGKGPKKDKPGKGPKKEK